MADDPLLDRLRSVLAAGPPLRLAILFGSHARGRARPDSDVDIAILPDDPGMTIAAEHRLIGELERAARTPVDLVRLDHARPRLRWSIARDGIVLASNPSWEAARFLARTGIEHDALQDLELDARRRFRARLAREATREPR